MDESLNELPEAVRTLLIRHFLQGVAQKELAAQLKVSAPTVSRKLKQALSQLRRRLRQKDILVGTDVVVAHMGLTTKGSIGAHTAKTLDQCVTEVQAIADAARTVRGDVIVLCHGGPIAMPEDAQHVLQRTSNVHGFYGASSLERLPTEVAIKQQMEKFKAVRFGE